MPYIDPKIRDKYSLPHTFRPADDAGSLNFQITELLIEYLNHKGMRYQTFNDILGALEGSKLELYRRQIADYESHKCEENGDVYNGVL